MEIKKNFYYKNKKKKALTQNITQHAEGDCVKTPLTPHRISAHSETDVEGTHHVKEVKAIKSEKGVKGEKSSNNKAAHVHRKKENLLPASSLAPATIIPARYTENKEMIDELYRSIRQKTGKNKLKNQQNIDAYVSFYHQCDISHPSGTNLLGMCILHEDEELMRHVIESVNVEMIELPQIMGSENYHWVLNKNEHINAYFTSLMTEKKLEEEVWVMLERFSAECLYRKETIHFYLKWLESQPGRNYKNWMTSCVLKNNRPLLFAMAQYAYLQKDFTEVVGDLKDENLKLCFHSLSLSAPKTSGMLPLNSKTVIETTAGASDPKDKGEKHALKTPKACALTDPHTQGVPSAVETVVLSTLSDSSLSSVALAANVAEPVVSEASTLAPQWTAFEAPEKSKKSTTPSHHSLNSLTKKPPKKSYVVAMVTELDSPQIAHISEKNQPSYTPMENQEPVEICKKRKSFSLTPLPSVKI